MLSVTVYSVPVATVSPSITKLTVSSAVSVISLPVAWPDGTLAVKTGLVLSISNETSLSFPAISVALIVYAPSSVMRRPYA